MHLLMPPILLGMSRFDKLHFDAQFHPPSAQPGQTQGAGGTEGRPIIDSDYLGHSVLLEKALKDQTGTGDVLLWQQIKTQKIAAGQISDRQGFNLGPVPSAKPALKIGRPNFVGLPGLGQGRSRNRRPSAGMPAPPSSQPPTL
jgi:hypothetical protein